MNCPFCQHANALTARACRVCGGPLSALAPEIAPKPQVTAPPVAPVAVVVGAPAPVEIARQTFAEDAGALVSVGFAPDENPTVCLIYAAGVAQLWDALRAEFSSFALGRLFRRAKPLCCALSARDFVAMGHENGEVRWHQLDARAKKNPAAHVGRVLALACNATHLYSGGSDGVIWATELDDGQAKSRALLEGLGAMRTFAVAPDATLVAVGCDDGAVQLWRATAEAAAKLDWTRRGHDAPLESLAFSPNGRMIISRDKSGRLNLWAAQTSYQLPLPPGAHTSHVPAVFSSDNRLLALANSADKVSIFDVALGTLLCELPPFGEPIAQLAWAPAGTWLVSAGARQVALWNVV